MRRRVRLEGTGAECRAERHRVFEEVYGESWDQAAIRCSGSNTAVQCVSTTAAKPPPVKLGPIVAGNTDYPLPLSAEYAAELGVDPVTKQPI